jgi:hypothetical protein
LPFKKVKGLNTKILGSLYLFRGKVPKTKREDFKSNRSTSLVNIFVISSPLKYKARKAFKKFLRKKLKIKAIKPLTFNRAKRQKKKL